MTVTLDDLRQSATGPPIKVRHLAQATGLSKRKLLLDVERNLLRVVRVPTGQREMYLVEWVDARRWLVKNGFLRAAPVSHPTV